MRTVSRNWCAEEVRHHGDEVLLAPDGKSHDTPDALVVHVLRDPLQGRRVLDSCARVASCSMMSKDVRVTTRPLPFWAQADAVEFAWRQLNPRLERTISNIQSCVPVIHAFWTLLRCQLC